MKKIARVVKQADFISKFTEKAKELGLKLGFNADVDYSWGKDTVHTIMYEKGGTTYLVVQVIITVDEYNYIRIYDTKNNLLGEYKIRGDNFDFNVFVPILNFVTDKLKEKEEQLKPQKTETKEVSHETILETAEQVYDFGEENNWQGLEDKHYKILSKDKNLAQMAVADMQDKELQVPEILKKFRRYSMSFKDVLISKIASEKKAEKVENKVEKKAAEEDVKLKVQKNKPAGLDTSSPKVLEGKTKKVFEDMIKASSDLNEVKADIEKFKAKTDKLIQKKIQKVGLDEKTAKLQELTNKVAQLMEKAQNVVFQNQDKLGVFINQTKTVPAKATDKWKVEKLIEFINKEIGHGKAEQYLKNAENGLQSQATEKAIKELVVFEPTKQQKTSATNDEESSIDILLNTMKDVYANLRNYYLSMVKTNNVIEDELLPMATASKENKVEKKAEEYENEEDVMFRIFEDFEMFTPEEISLCTRGWGKNLETAETMLYVRTGLRSLEQLRHDFEDNGYDMSDYYTTEEKEHKGIKEESKKKVNLKKAKKVNKKAGKITVEMDSSDYMDLLRDRAKEIGRELIMEDELEQYIEGIGNIDITPMVFVDNYLINGEFIERNQFSTDGDYSDLYAKYNGDWNEMCDNEAVFYNEEMACLNLGL